MSITLYSLLAVSFLLLNAQMTLASQVTLAWDPSNEPGISGYKIYYGTSSRNYTASADVGNADTYTVTGLSQGQTYYFAVTAHDAQGHESSYSNEVSANIAGACTYSLSSASQSFDANGGSGTVSVTAGSGCSWTASNPASWITISSGQAGSGNGALAYTVSQNTSATARSATLTIGGRTYTVSQTAPQGGGGGGGGTCTYSLSSASQSFDANGGTGTVNIVAGSGCSWTVSNPASWITISSGQTGSGSGTVTYRVSQNASDVDRLSALTIAGSPYTISQDASTTAPVSTPVTTSSNSGAASGGGDAGGGGGGGGCFIATAAFGSYIDPHVMLLRSFRDTFLLTSRSGSAFVNWYYSTSPAIADTIQKSEALKAGVRIMLIPVIGFGYLCLTLGILPTLFLIILMSITLVFMVRRIGD